VTFVSRLALDNFRSYADVLLSAGPGLVVLTGENGAGKTNVLEAVSLLAPGRGLRQAPLGDMAHSDGPGCFAISARLADPADDSVLVDIGTGTTAAAPERRQARINGAAAALTSLGEWLSVLWLTPAMDRLFTESAGGRRRFLDRLTLALEPGHAVQAARYEAAMRARNRLLSDERPPDPQWLSALEAQMAEHGAALAIARERTVTQLGERLAAQPPGPFARADVALDGWRPDADAPAEGLRTMFAANRAVDRAAGRTTAGPHRTDLAVAHHDKGQPAHRCSTGEQKALLLGLVLGHADLVAELAGRRPVLLLDEVAAHLDPHRRTALFNRLEASGGQVWMTGTEPGLFAGIEGPATWLAVHDRRVEPRL